MLTMCTPHGIVWNKLAPSDYAARFHFARPSMAYAGPRPYHLCRPLPDIGELHYEVAA